MLCIALGEYNMIVDKESLGLLKREDHYVIKYYNKNKIQIQYFYTVSTSVYPDDNVEIDSVFLNDCLNIIKDLMLKFFSEETDASYENETIKAVLKAKEYWGTPYLRIYKKENEKEYKVAGAYGIKNCRNLYKLFKTILVNGKVGIKEYDEVTPNQITYVENICKKLKKPFWYNPLEQSFNDFVKLSEQEYKKATEKQINTIKMISDQLAFESKENIEINEALTRQEASKIICNYKNVFDRAKKRAEKRKKTRLAIDKAIRDISYSESSGGFDSRDEWEFMAHMEYF